MSSAGVGPLRFLKSTINAAIYQETSCFLLLTSFVEMLISWCSRPVPFAEKHPQRMMFPPPCFTVGTVFLGLFSSFFFLQTWRVEFRPKSSIFVSSDHMTF
ncbi:hypothetical protein AMECASPLE_015488 [Ameca splendens]|uniref:Uncharacterized protein n=1 Tax=Ameca splendens TaxID=208324 RepID=A0ABV0XF03_9TELE